MIAKGLNLYTTLGDVGLVTGEPSTLQEVVSSLVRSSMRCA